MMTTMTLTTTLISMKMTATNLRQPKRIREIEGYQGNRNAAVAVQRRYVTLPMKLWTVQIGEIEKFTSVPIV